MLRPWKTILQIELNSDKAVFQQIADGIITEIKKGRLQPGASLPGSRVLAESLAVNRKTVVLAYEELIAEGWLSTAYKQGTFVSESLPAPGKTRETKAEKPHTFQFNTYQTFPQEAQKATISFNDGLPDVRLAPLDELARAYKRIFQQNARWRMMGYGNEKGEERLRAAICKMLTHDRGLSVSPETICITKGSQMALYLAAQVLVKKGDYVAIETPGYLPAYKAFELAGANLQPVKVDEKGISVTALEKICKRKKIKAVYVTPHHQFPTTVSMKADRRLQLIALSNKYGFAIVEDDYDHEYHFGLRSLLPLASHEQAGNVIYISSLSKLIAPAVRLGYITGPRKFIDAIAALRMIIDRQGDAVMENAVAELMESGEVNRHVRRAFAIYKERRDQMERCLEKHLRKQVTFLKPEGGLAYWVQFKKKIDTNELATRLMKKGVSIIPTDRFSFDHTPLHALRLGYASLTEAELEEGIRILAAGI